MKRLALLGAASMLAIAPGICSITRDGDDEGGGGGSAPAKSTMNKAEIDTLLDGPLDTIMPRLAGLTPATRRKIAAAEDTRGGEHVRRTLIDAIERLGDAAAVLPDPAEQAPADRPEDVQADQAEQLGASGENAAAEPATTVIEQPATAADPPAPSADNRSADANGDAARIAALEGRLEAAELRASEATSRAEGLEAELAPHRANELERGPDYVANLEQRLRDASAVEPVEKVRGLVLEAGGVFGVEAQDGEDTPSLVERFIAKVEAHRVDTAAKLTNAQEDVRELNAKLTRARKKADPGALAKGRESGKPRKVGPDFPALEADNGDQKPLDRIMNGDDALELVFSNGTDELLEFQPYDVRGTSFERHAGGWRLRDPILLKGSSEDTRVRGVALLLHGKQIAWSAFAEAVRVPRNQEVNFDKMISF